jgi:hypothetical protein
MSDYQELINYINKKDEEIAQLKEQLKIAKSALLEIDQFVVYSKQDEVLPSEIAREALEQLNKE